MIRRLVALGLVVLCVSSVAASFKLLRGPGLDMTAAAQGFLKSLDDAQKQKAALTYDSAERTKWHFIPLAERKGLQIKEMNESQRTAALALLKSCLSQVGYQKAEVIMGLEAILRELEKTKVGGAIRDPERYYWTVYGKPETSGTWGLSIEGHHLSLNFVVQDGELASYTPSFFGANPAIVMNQIEGGAAKGTRILAKEETLAFDLLASLTDEQRTEATIARNAPKEIRGAGEVEVPNTAPEGLAAEKLDADQKTVLENLMDAYLDNMPADVAGKRRAEIDGAGFDKIYFAWAGADKPGIGHYYRVQGPTFLIEFINVQPDAAGNPANHIHSAWRDLRGDFALTKR